MTSANWPNRTLFHGDNLEVMRGMNSGTIDLIATDPPFNKGKDFHATPDSLSAGASFEDRWLWDEHVHPAWVDTIQDDNPKLWQAILSAKEVHSEAMGAFCCFMAVRLLAMHRLLKPTGSIYVHCDQTANSYIRMVMDAIFGGKNFRNEIIWERSSSKNDAKRQYGRVKDSILFYSKTDDCYFQQSFVKNADAMAKASARYNLDDEDGKGPYMTAPLEGLGGGGWYEYKGVKPGAKEWNVSLEYMKKLDDEGRLRFPKKDGGRLRKKVFLSEFNGVPISDLWCDIRALLNKSPERTGYPTQKPIALYERIIKASCPDGGIVLDPFAGCATTCVAAEKMGVQWVGIDIWDGAVEVTQNRMRQECQGFLGGAINASDLPPIRTDDGQISSAFLKTPKKIVSLEPAGPKMAREEMVGVLVEKHGMICQGCHRSFDHPSYLEIDHILPRSDGGVNHISNRILLCRPCNGRKSNSLTLSGLRKENQKIGFMDGQACKDKIRSSELFTQAQHEAMRDDVLGSVHAKIAHDNDRKRR